MDILHLLKEINTLKGLTSIEKKTMEKKESRERGGRKDTSVEREKFWIDTPLSDPIKGRVRIRGGVLERVQKEGRQSELNWIGSLEERAS